MEETLAQIPKQYRDENIRKFQPDLEEKIEKQLPPGLYGALNEDETWTSLRPSYEPLDVDSGLSCVVPRCSNEIQRHRLCSGFELR